MKKFITRIKELGFKGIFLMNLGFFCCALASALFISPAKLVPGGGAGLSQLLEMISGIPYYVFLYGINIILIIIAFFMLGSSFAIKTIFGSLMYPTYSFLITFICSIETKDGTPLFDIAKYIGEVNPVFIVIFAALLMGFGIGINMKLGGSTGGFDIIEAIALKYFHIPYSTTMYSLDAIIIIIGMFVYNNGLADLTDAQIALLPFKTSWLSEGFGATIYVFLVGFVVDTITFGGYNKRAVYIRSEKYEEISDMILNNLVRGCTYLDATGAYSKTSTKMLLCICYSKEYFKLRELIQEIDPNAFIFMTRAEEVRGLGFNYETKEYIAWRKAKKKKNEEAKRKKDCSN